ncbi:Isoquinoline 1-oxidoreductase [Alteripontixanthobacter maritimus]|uniref:Isoquinoline 1-oxidoreductase n=1 Tax=Alteripontixanthobacter maritimus TaxID=2161824 RepID=A0A369Q3G5_9SPHN|nr:molybdopterin cofactor-binding domain-containing protein [Alteripontixanthobacter maritimus]RDC59052.1 Isoquinoline 1-oxidoreductase [Alteripontixanthobacter maritimus]
MGVTRRGVLVGAALGGGLLAAWGLAPRNFSTPLTPGRGEQAFGAWLTIGDDGVVTVAVPQLEMGQGVTTILPQIIATELGADWRQIAVEPAPVSGAYANIPMAAKWAPLWLPGSASMLRDMTQDSWLASRYAQETRFTATAGGSTLEAYELPCREAAAAARMMLTEEAAARWNVDPLACTVADGFVRHDRQQASFAELADDAAQRDLPDPLVLRAEPAGETVLPGIGEDTLTFPRLDLPSKVDGSMLFAGDVRLPDMTYAAIRHAPAGTASLGRFRTAAVKDMAGLIKIVEGKDWLAAIAETSWLAERALAHLAPVFRAEDRADSLVIEAALDEGVRRGKSAVVARSGDAEASFYDPDFALRYDIAPALHATLETTTATARLKDGRLELWVAAQAPERAREAAAKAVGVRLSDTVLYPMPAGGSFDRRLEHGHAIEAALLAREMEGRPVQLTWSRWQEHLAGYPRTPAAAVVTAKLTSDGTLRTMKTRIAAPPAMLEFGHRLFGNLTPAAARRESVGKPDPLALEGALPPYNLPAAAVEHAPVDIGLPVAPMRGQGHGITAFITESFIDEVATRAGREPLSYRIAMLGGDPRMVECLQRAARIAQWGGGGDRSGQGLACHRMGDTESGGRIACIATARPDSGGEDGGASGGVRVTSLHAAVDIGRIVNLDIARQQIEGGLIYGLGLAVGSATGYRQGLPTARSLADLDLPTLASSPDITVEFVASDEAPFDPGELGAVIAAPAIANALFSATGLRLRRLPLLSEGL